MYRVTDRFYEKFHKILNGIIDIGVLCVGDTILDKTVECRLKFISQEAPVMVAEQASSSLSLGGRMSQQILLALASKQHWFPPWGRMMKAARYLSFWRVSGLTPSSRQGRPSPLSRPASRAEASSSCGWIGTESCQTLTPSI